MMIKKIRIVDVDSATTLNIEEGDYFVIEFEVEAGNGKVYVIGKVMGVAEGCITVNCFKTSHIFVKSTQRNCDISCRRLLRRANQWTKVICVYF